jgi:hypothetical protein
MRLVKNGDTTRPLHVLMVDSTDHVTAKTGLTLTVTRSKNGAAFGAWAGTSAEIANGIYKLTPAAGDVDTQGELVIHATGTAADPADLVAEVVAFDPHAVADLGLSNLNATVSSRLAASAYVDHTASIAAVQADTDDIQARLPAALVGGRMDASIGAVATGVITAAAIAADAIGASELAADAVAEIAAAVAVSVWTETLASHLTAGSTGAGLNAAGSAGDPWSTTLPGGYGAGSAGKIVGDNLNATVASRLATSGYTAPDNATVASLATSVAALPTAVANADALLDRTAGIETGLTLRQAMRLLAAASAVKVARAATTTITIRNAVADSKARITATVDSDGNRSAISTDVT